VGTPGDQLVGLAVVERKAADLGADGGGSATNDRIVALTDVFS
jgi:hypothetical protein